MKSSLEPTQASGFEKNRMVFGIQIPKGGVNLFVSQTNKHFQKLTLS
ncbi:hypothetical protein Hac_1602 [Helicobacter acinonychis str. Sheeba]|uniref:Uncharacterized protein n=1 Tax=Helicobacter acinonychis (strain Sheeba) TaxID=382638 RepID=Q17VL3_HELAH|nr:hypothetical protein [Helicobacter acinonychis]CAK00313.1 hypothetical protein Hac_1602 [Helicobacter acinonychis str. Sheeba]